MIETKQERGLGLDDIALMRAVVRWRRERKDNGEPQASFSTNRGWGGFLSWKETYPVAIRRRRSVAVEVVHAGSPDPEDFPRQLSMTIDRWHEQTGESSTVEIEPASLTEAVDILVTFGFLPPRFSSAYRAGWDARREAATVACRDGMGSPGPDSPEVRALEPAVRR